MKKSKVVKQKRKKGEILMKNRKYLINKHRKKRHSEFYDLESQETANFII